MDIVRFNELIPCRTAFIDAHTPGSDQKENYTIIGVRLQSHLISMYISVKLPVSILGQLHNLRVVQTPCTAIGPLRYSSSTLESGDFFGACTVTKAKLFWIQVM